MKGLYLEAVRNAGNHAIVLSSPADVFAVCAKLARQTGCYLQYASIDKSHLVESAVCVRDGDAWSRALEDVSSQSITPGFLEGMPKQVVSSWEVVGRWLRKFDYGKHEPPLNNAVVKSILYLIAVADEACAGLGLPDGGVKSFFGFISNARLSFRGTLCRFLNPRRVRVLPKQHTPKFGLNLRNLTHHLAFCDESEVAVKWSQSAVIAKRRASFNVLLVPWPFNVVASDIKPSRRASKNQRVGYFDVAPRLKGSPVREVLSVINKAIGTGQRVDLVVMPECAIDEKAWATLAARLATDNIAILAGVSGAGKEKNIFTNSVRLKVPGVPGDSLIQHKHHRWKIERNQIRNYGLGGTLDCNMEWWENIEVRQRQINFFAFTDNLVVCPLVCEDLARQDPVADIVRSVGPNLVVALLMDGPQLSGRWSARYASVLADDPGSSVLTISSLGMVNLSRPPGGGDRRKVIASWKEAQGSFVEICLEEGSRAALLNLQFMPEMEQSVDGRGDAGVASTPVLAGIHYV